VTTRQAAKAKGRRLEASVVEAILSVFPDLTDEDVTRVAASCGGEDIVFSKRAQAKLGLSVECKARKGIAVYAWHEQCRKNAGGRTPVTVIKADRKKPLALVDLDTLLALIARVSNDG
jgi:hypothetical protein